MPDFNDWLTQTKANKPELTEFVNRIAPFFIETGFNITSFEKAIASGLDKAEKDTLEQFTKKEDAKN